jgi:hypothetical protein
VQLQKKVAATRPQDFLKKMVPYGSCSFCPFERSLRAAPGEQQTGVFVRVVFALKNSISGHGSKPSMILTQIRYKQNCSYQKIIKIKNFTKGGNAQKKKQNANREKW